MHSPYPDRPGLQRRPLTAPAPIRPHPGVRLADATGTPGGASHPVLKPHPLRTSHLAESSSEAGTTITAAAETEKYAPSEKKVRPRTIRGEEADADAEAELREIVTSLAFQRSLLGSHREEEPEWEPKPSTTTSSSSPVRAPSSTSTSSSSYLNRAPRTPSRGGGARSRNGHGLVTSLRRKASHGGGGGGGGGPFPEQVPMQLDGKDTEQQHLLLPGSKGSGGTTTNTLTGGKPKRVTPPISFIGFDGRRHSPPSRVMTRNPFRQTPSSFGRVPAATPFSNPSPPKIVRSATEPALPPPTTTTTTRIA
ncbi:hypothetical protein JCM3774_005319 [Rhodotorula dairenensis]